MANLLLVHGSWHGAWCWERVAPLLLEAGHDARAIDLPAHGDDPRSPWLVTLRQYRDCLIEAAGGFDSAPVAVGHSMGGLAITAAAAHRPEAFAGLVYLCAFAPLRGDSLLRLSRGDEASLVSESIRWSWSGPHIRPERARRLFYGACSESDAALATSRLRPDPVRPLVRRLLATAPESMPRAYIECTQDRAIGIEWQRAMARRAGIEKVATLETDHSPFFSTPRELASHLDALADWATGSQ